MTLRRAMTMIETLLALALLGAITLAASSWLGSVGRFGPNAIEPARQRVVAEAAFARIADSLQTGDFKPSSLNQQSPQPPRVRIEAGELRIDTRHGTTMIYRFDRPTRQLLVQIKPSSAARPLLFQSVRDFACSIDDKHQILDVRIELDNGASADQRLVLSRRYRVK